MSSNCIVLVWAGRSISALTEDHQNLLMSQIVNPLIESGLSKAEEITATFSDSVSIGKTIGKDVLEAINGNVPKVETDPVENALSFIHGKYEEVLKNGIAFAVALTRDIAESRYALSKGGAEDVLLTNALDILCSHDIPRALMKRYDITTSQINIIRRCYK